MHKQNFPEFGRHVGLIVDEMTTRMINNHQVRGRVESGRIVDMETQITTSTWFERKSKK